MEIRTARSDNAPEPVGPYSHAVVAGEFVFCSGQMAFDPKTGEFIGLQSSVEEETVRVMDNLGAVLDAAGSSFDKVVKATIYITDMNDFALVNKVYAGYFGSNPPARATVEVSGLAKGCRVEIDCIAVIDR